MRKRLTSAAQCAIKMRSKGSDRVQAIKRDIMNGPLHCFGYHESCSADFCSTVQNKQANVTSAEASDLEDEDDVTEAVLGKFDPAKKCKIKDTILL